MSLPPSIDPFPEHTEALCKALGRGLLRWQYVETALYLIALSLMGTDHETGSRIFFHIKSAESKLALVDKLVNQKLDQRVRTKFWKGIVSDIRDAIEFRNCLAHFEFFILTDEEMKKIIPKTKFRAAVSHHNLDNHATRGGTTKVLSVESLDHNADETKFLAYKLIYFTIDHVPQIEQLLERLPLGTRQWLDSFRKTVRPPEFPRPRGSSTA